jgi:hypothetical protein
MERIIQKALEKDSEVRYQSAAELRADLKRLKRDTSSGKIPAAAPSSQAASAKSRWLWIAAAIVGIALLSTLFFLLRSRSILQNPLSNAQFTRLTDFDGAETNPAISPDGKFVAFAPQDERPALSVTCSADRPSYAPSDTVKLTLTVENRVSSGFYVYRTVEWGWAGVRFRLTDAAGNSVPEPGGNRPSLPTPPIYDKSQLVGLAPERSLGSPGTLQKKIQTLEMSLKLWRYLLPVRTDSSPIEFRGV